MPNEVYDPKSGALLFKSTPAEQKQKKQQEMIEMLCKRIDELENRIDRLEIGDKQYGTNT